MCFQFFSPLMPYRYGPTVAFGPPPACFLHVPDTKPMIIQISVDTGPVLVNTTMWTPLFLCSEILMLLHCLLSDADIMVFLSDYCQS